MASNLLKFNIQTIKTTDQNLLKKHSSFSSSSSFTSTTLSLRLKTSKSQTVTKIHCALSSPTPPSSKEAAILQAKTCLSTTLEKPLSTTKLTTAKLKRPKQSRFRLEIPVNDDSPESVSQLALEVFRELPTKRRGSLISILIIWPDFTYKKAALKVFESLPKCPIEHTDISSISDTDTRVLSSTDVAVFVALDSSKLAVAKGISDGLFPRPLVMFNPRWAFEEESDFEEAMRDFVKSFEVIYSFMGLEVRGILSKRKGVIFKCVRDGVLSGEKWSILVEEESGELRAVSSFKARPSIAEVEGVLYNLMAMNSPVTKSVKFLKGLVSNVTGKKE